MRWLACLSFIVVVGCASLGSDPGAARIVKVLPHFIDQEGRHTLSPSLYERDAYQEVLRRHSEQRSGLRFDMLYNAPPVSFLTLQVEMRGTLNNRPTANTSRAEGVRFAGGRDWGAVVFRGDEYKTFGELLAWRATLWDGTNLLAQQTSFLW